MASTYRAFYGTFWTGETGRELKRRGRDAQLLAIYLFTSPHANMIGLYYLPWSYIVEDTGIDLQAAQDAMEQIEAVGFAVYDRNREWVWVCGAVDHQVKLKSASTVEGARAQVADCGSPALLAPFMARYGTPLGYPPEAPPIPPPGPLHGAGAAVEAPPIPPPVPIHASKPARGGVCRSETETETETERETENAAGAAPLSTGSAWEDWRQEWNADPKRRQLALAPINGDLPKFAEAARRYPDASYRRRLMRAYFASKDKQVLKNPFTVGWFLHWADRLADTLEQAEAAATAEREFLAS
jgi:hypothetical protein